MISNSGKEQTLKALAVKYDGVESFTLGNKIKLSKLTAMEDDNQSKCC